MSTITVGGDLDATMTLDADFVVNGVGSTISLTHLTAPSAA